MTRARTEATPPGRRKAATPPGPSAAFAAACSKAGVAEDVAHRLWALHEQRAADGRPRWSVEELLLDHAAWRQFVRSRVGDEAAAAAVHERWSSELAAFCSGRFSRADADELASLFFTRLYRLVGPDFAWSAPFTAYVRTIMLNLARDFRERAGRTRLREPSLDRRREDSDWEPASPGPTPEREVLQREQADIVRAALGELSPGDQFIVNACLVDGLSGDEVAEILGIDRDAAYQRLHRARARLKKGLAKSGLLKPASPPKDTTRGRRGT